MDYRAIIAMAVALALAGCNEDVGGVGTSTFYDCGNGTRLKVDFVDAESVMVQMNDDTPITIPAVKAASGAKYTDARHTFWSKGDQAEWIVGRMAPMTCNKVMLPRGM